MSRFSILPLLALLMATSSGCAYMGGLQPAPGPSADASVDPSGVHVHVDTHIGQALLAQLPPSLEYQDQHGGWQPVRGRYIDIPGTRDGINVRLRLHGLVTKTSVTYDGNTWEVGPGGWQFWLCNKHDGGMHPLMVNITYQNYGANPTSYATQYPFMALNNQGY